MVARRSFRRCPCYIEVVSAWALAHHHAIHLGELTELCRQRAAEAVGVQILGWGGERTKHESVRWRAWIIERDNERKCTASFEARELIAQCDGDGRDAWLCVIGRSSCGCCPC